MKIADCRLEKMESVDRKERIWGKVEPDEVGVSAAAFSQEERHQLCTY
jgi:hypothetical protein